MSSIRGRSSSASSGVRRQASVSAVRTLHRDHEQRRGGLGHVPPGTDDRVHDLVPELSGGPGTARDLRGGFKEREPWAGPFLAMPAWTRAHPRRRPQGCSRIHWKRRSFRGAATTQQLGWPGGCSVFNDDLASAVLRRGGGHDAVVGQVEEAGGSVERHNRRLSQDSWSCSGLNARHTHPSRATCPLVTTAQINTPRTVNSP